MKCKTENCNKKININSEKRGIEYCGKHRINTKKCSNDLCNNTINVFSTLCRSCSKIGNRDGCRQ